MELEEKLQFLRNQNGYSQEQLANEIGISRQTISKWENGQAIPELNSLILLSKLYGVTIDRIVTDNDMCNISLSKEEDLDLNRAIAFLIRAKKNTYAGKGTEIKPLRISSHDFSYTENDYIYYDTYLGSEKFTGEETIWLHEKPIWGMNYCGRVLGENFNNDFLKEALFCVSEESPYRGPEIFTKGDYHYHCKVEGAFTWYQGYEEIFYLSERIYECYFHGGVIQ